MSINTIGIPTDQLTLSKTTLETLLAEEYKLYQKTLAYHWNVKGPHFSMLHALFEEHYNWLSSLQDELAERLKMLGFNAAFPHTENPSDSSKKSGDAMLADLLENHQRMAISIRAALKEINETDDFVTQDLLTTTLAEHEKHCWVLSSHLEG